LHFRPFQRFRWERSSPYHLQHVPFHGDAFDAVPFGIAVQLRGLAVLREELSQLGFPNPQSRYADGSPAARPSSDVLIEDVEALLFREAVQQLRSDPNVR